MKPLWNAFLSVSILALGALPAHAQPVISAKSGVVSYIIGKVMVGDEAVKPSETKLTEVKEGAVLRTEDGRAEVLLTLGAILRTGDNSSFKMLTNRLIDTRVELLTGTHILEVAEIQKDNNLTLVAKDATVVITKRGIYRFDVDQSHIKVFEGVLGVTVNGQSTLVGAGKMLDTATASVEKFDKEATDAMDHWAKRRAELVAMANASSAKQVHDYGCSPNSNFAAINGVGANNPCSNPCNSWTYNRWYGLITYIPCGANIYSPYGYRYWSPYNVMRAYYVPPAPVYNTGGGGFGGGGGVYTGMSQTSSGYSGAMSAPSSSVSSSTAAVSSGTSTAASAASASSGHGASGGGGGHK